MHITKYLLGLLLLVQGICLCPCLKRQDPKKIEREERLKNRMGTLKSSFENNGVICDSNLQAPVWVYVKLSQASENVLNEAARLVKEAKYYAYSLPKNLSYDGVLIQLKNQFKNSEDVEFQGYCRENVRLNNLFGINLPII